MDINLWLNNMQHIHNSITDMDPSAMSDCDFMLITINNLLQSGGNWNSFMQGLCKRINQYDNCLLTPRSIRSIEFISAIRHEFILISKDNPDTNVQIFTACIDAEKRAAKCPHPLDADTLSSSSSSKCPRSNKTCSNPNCNWKGHEISECFMFGGNIKGNYPDWWRGPFNIHLQPKLHTKANNIPPSLRPAFVRIKQQSTTQTTAQTSAQANLTHTPDTTQVQLLASSDTKVESPDIILMSHFNNNTVITTLPVFDPQQPKLDVCLFDSDANCHIFNDQNFFESYQSISPIDIQGIGTNCLMKAIGCGNVRLQTHCVARVFSIVLTDILHIPHACSNLISGGQFDECGVYT